MQKLLMFRLCGSHENNFYFESGTDVLYIFHRSFYCTLSISDTSFYRWQVQANVLSNHSEHHRPAMEQLAFFLQAFFEHFLRHSFSLMVFLYYCLVLQLYCHESNLQQSLARISREIYFCYQVSHITCNDGNIESKAFILAISTGCQNTFMYQLLVFTSTRYKEISISANSTPPILLLYALTTWGHGISFLA